MPLSLCAYSAPGIATDAEAAAWRPVVDRVHAKGAAIYMQIFHAGGWAEGDGWMDW